jgi:hypothetical protein
VDVTLDPLVELDAAARRAVERAATLYGAFIGLPVSVA